MFGSIVYFSLLVFCASFGNTKNLQSINYYPLAIGNSWEYIDIYEKDKSTIKTYKEVAGDTTINDTLYYRVIHPEFGGNGITNLYRANNGVVYGRNLNTAKESIIIPAVDSVGSSVITYNDTISVRITIVATDARIKTPLKKYKRLLCLKYENLKSGVFYYLYYKAGVGLVAMCDQQGKIVSYLTSFRQGDKSLEKTIKQDQ